MAKRFARMLAPLAAVLALGASACEPVKLPHETPGPPGAGQRDPRTSGPTTMSVAQNKVYRENGSPDELVDNDKGGKDWLYYRSVGSVFGEQQSVEIFTFDAQGLLVKQHTELQRKVGK